MSDMDREILRSSARGAALMAAALALLALTACGDTKRALGLEKDAPDEFAVVSRAPLALPPDYSLRPPRPGAPRPQEDPVQEQARQTVFGVERDAKSGTFTRSAAAGGASTVLANAPAAAPQAGVSVQSVGDSAFLARAGADTADPTIRRTVDRETARLADADVTFLDQLLNWRDEPVTGTVVDADSEAQRIRENQALGRPSTDGVTPQIEKRRRGLLEGIF